MTKANRWLLYGPFSAFGIFLIVWAFIWRAGGDAMRESLAEFAATQSARGIAVDYLPLKARGFPFFLRAAVADFSIAQGEDRYECAKLFIDALPYAPDRIIFSCGVSQHVVRRGASWIVRAENARASIERDEARGWVLKAETGALKADNGADAVSLTRAVINVAPAAKNSDSLQASVRVVGFSSAIAEIERFDAAVSLSPADAAGGRTLALNGVEILANGSTMRGAGSLFLHKGASATGRIDAEIEKPAGLAHAFEKARLLEKDEAIAAEAGLGMLAVASGGVIRAPIDIANGEIRLAGVKLAELRKKDQP